MPDRRLTDLRTPDSIGAGLPTTAPPPASTIAAGGSGHGPASFGLADFWACLAEASRRMLGMLTAAIIAATIAAGLYTTERYAELADTFMTEQTQNVLDIAVADLVWNDYRQAVTGLVVRSLDGTSMIAALDGFRNAPDAVTRPARLWLHGPGQVDETTAPLLAQFDGAIETTALSDALAARRLAYIALGLLLGLGLAAGAIGLVAQSLRRAEAARSAADRSAARHRLADDLEREFRGFAETMAATASRFEGPSKGVAETARTASGESRAALGDGARVARRLGAIVEGADTAGEARRGEATAELMAGAGQFGHEARALLARVDAMLDRLRAA